MLADIAAGLRILWRLPSFLSHPLTLDEARATVRHRLERREPDFLALARRAIYGRPESPYRRLLAHAGCEYGDLERLVTHEGVEGALRVLCRQGVYLTVDEAKGRRAVVRGGVDIAVSPRGFWNPASVGHFAVQSSGSRGRGAPVPVDLAFVRETAADECLVLDARGGSGWRHAIWNVPGGAALGRLLGLSALAAYPERWFSQIDPAAPGLHPRYRWSARAIRWASVLMRAPLPRPRRVSVENPLPIVGWMTTVLRQGGTPHLLTLASSAVRLAQAAQKAGITLQGCQFTISGEPITEARLAAIRATGAQAVPRYGSAESAGAVGHGCLAPEAPDDLHLPHDLHALIQPGPQNEDRRLPPGTLLITSLRSTAPMVLLNVSLGDQAVLTRRACGCPLDRLWPWHVYAVRSYEKLTAGGMTFLDSDVIRVLEQVLPARFGGGPTDYQLVEEEAADGRPRLRLLVHPRVGALDVTAVKDVFHRAIDAGSGVERVMGLAWRDAGLLEVERRAPLTGASGKILHLHLARSRYSASGSGHAVGG